MTENNNTSGNLPPQRMKSCRTPAFASARSLPLLQSRPNKGSATPVAMLLIALTFGLLLGFGTVALRAQNGGGCCGAGGGGGVGGDSCKKNRPEKTASISVSGSGQAKGQISGTIGPISISAMGGQENCASASASGAGSVQIGVPYPMSVNGITQGYSLGLSIGNHEHGEGDGHSGNCCGKKGELYLEVDGSDVGLATTLTMRPSGGNNEGSECQNEDCDCPCRPYEPPPSTDCPECTDGTKPCDPCEGTGRD